MFVTCLNYDWYKYGIRIMNRFCVCVFFCDFAFCCFSLNFYNIYSKELSICVLKYPIARFVQILRHGKSKSAPPNENFIRLRILSGQMCVDIAFPQIDGHFCYHYVDAADSFIKVASFFLLPFYSSFLFLFCVCI